MICFVVIGKVIIKHIKKLVAFKTKTKIYKILKYFHKLIMIRSCHDVSNYGLEKIQYTPMYPASSTQNK